MELTQKSTRLEQTTQQQQQLQEQLNKANADLNTSSDHQEQATKQLAELKIELDNTKIELSAKSAQLETTLKSMQTQVGLSHAEVVAELCTQAYQACYLLNTDLSANVRSLAYAVLSACILKRVFSAINCRIFCSLLSHTNRDTHWHICISCI